MQEFLDILQLEFLGNTLLQWSLALLAFLATFTVLPLLKSYVTARGRKREQAGHELPVALDAIVELIGRTSRLFLWIVAVYIGSRFLDLDAISGTAVNAAGERVSAPGDSAAEKILSFLVIVISWLQVGIWIVAAIRFALERRRHREGAPDAVASGSLTIIMFVAHLAVWAIVALLALSNLGVNITALVAGLGVGGIAIALAVQTILGDLLASLSIAFDKPFRIGDTLGVDDYTGTVEDIGIKSTRLRSVNGEQLIISNADILKSRVRNLGRMPEQRALLAFSLRYDTGPEKLPQVSKTVEAIVKAQPDTRFVQCILKGFGTNGLDFELIYYVVRPTSHAQTVDAVNHQIYTQLANAGFRFSAPSKVSFQATRPTDEAPDAPVPEKQPS